MKKRMPKRKFTKIRQLILSSFKEKQLTAYEISKKTGIFWPTVKSHLIYLKGMDLVKEVFKHNRMKVFALTEEGKKYLRGGKR